MKSAETCSCSLCNKFYTYFYHHIVVLDKNIHSNLVYLLLFFLHHFKIGISHKPSVKCLLTTWHFNQKSNTVAQRRDVHNYRLLVHDAYVHFKLPVRFPGNISMRKCDTRKFMACQFHYQPRNVTLQSEQYLSFPLEQLNKF